MVAAYATIPASRSATTFHTAETVEEARSLLADHEGQAALSAGSTYLMLRAAHGEALPAHLVSLHRVGGLDALAEGELGALVTVRRLERSPAVGAQRALTMAASVTAGPPVRTLGTVGGNLGFVDGDLVPALLALDATVHLDGGETLPVAEYVDRRPQARVITGLTHPLRAADGWGGATVKLARRGMDWPIVTVAAAVRVADGAIADARVAAGALAPDPLLLPAVSAVLIGSEGEPEALDYAAEAATHRIDVRGDDEASAAYRARAARAVVRRALELALRLGPDAAPATGQARL